ncbi:MAG: 2-oxoglutarate dehydrogenase complex dihydrolipoyllysine-residue succinyltransferase [Deferrisomatales bacterium]|nr:2-oxoglutarate dehydrogenase complex dihydrolipoyllysine-residue succinyltransferase [Deferrisomatales bacterium]
MELDIRIPEGGESVQEALLAEWFVSDGATVGADEALLLLETDKVTLEIPAEAAGVVQILVPAGSTVAVGDVVGKIRVGATEGAQPAAGPPQAQAPEAAAPLAEDPSVFAPAQPRAEDPAAPEPAPAAPQTLQGLGPAVRSLVTGHGLDPAAIRATGPGGRITKGDVLLHLESTRAVAPATRAAPATQAAPATTAGRAEGVTRKALSPIRKRIAERLLQAAHSTAMLTTFNEIDMGEVMSLRERYKDAFLKRYGVKLGITSFFVKAVVEALAEFPQLNAFIDGGDMVQNHHYHVGVAVGAARGLVVPVVRHADHLSFAEIERAIAGFVTRIQDNKLELSDMEGGTFTITNGGVFGSLLSTPILNYPQSGILGLHKVEPRPVVVDGEIVVRSMMYVALSYDHRLVDGREAVQFLARIKALVEDPERLLVEV